MHNYTLLVVPNTEVALPCWSAFVLGVEIFKYIYTPQDKCVQANRFSVLRNLNGVLDLMIIF